MRKYFLFIIINLIFCIFVSAQTRDSLVLNLKIKDKKEFDLNSVYKIKEEYRNKQLLENDLKSLLKNLQKEAYLEASIDSLIYRDSIHVLAKIYIGEKYKWAHLKNGNIDPGILNKVGFKEKLYQNKPFYYTEVLKIQESLLKFAEENGHPFAQVWLDSLQVENGQLSGQLFMHLNREVRYKKIITEGDAKITEAYLSNYLGIKKGNLYDERQIKKIRQRLKELPFLREKGDPLVIFIRDEATVNLILQKRKASRFDFLLGLLPNNTDINPEQAPRLLITGMGEMDLQNPFGTGKRLKVQFEQLRPGTQKLDVEFQYPYILGIAVGADASFNLYKRDSTYLDVIQDVGVKYLMEGGSYFKTFWNNNASSLLTIDEDKILDERKLPDFLDIRKNSVGVEYAFTKLDYRFNPRKGFAIKTRLTASIKTIEENNQIVELTDFTDPDFDFSTLYDTLDLRSFQYQIAGGWDQYFPLFERSALKLAIQGGIMISKEDIFQNEMFRLGGNRLLRGFDEESVFTSAYAVSTLEYRFIIGQNAYMFAFGDVAYLKADVVENRDWDTPIGLGAGMTFETKAGIFGLSYAIGRQLDNAFDFNRSKIHFGYKNYF